MKPWSLAWFAMVEARFLVLEDEAPVAKGIARAVRGHGTPVMARTVQEALSLLGEVSHLAGLILDVGLPDGSGIDVLARARPTHPTTPALVLGGTDRSIINAACHLGAAYLVKPVAGEAVERFVLGASAAGFATRLDRAVKASVKRYGLSEAEADVLRGAALGESREATAERRDASAFTVKRQIGTILARTSESSFQAVVARLLREVAGAA